MIRSDGFNIRLTSNIDLRQLEWRYGSNAIRAYLWAKPGGIFELKGVLVKKGNAQQDMFIRDLFLEIDEEAQEQES